MCIGLDPTPSPSATVETDIQSTDVHKSTHPLVLVLKLPETLSVTKHHVDFVRCEDVDTANAVKKCMEQQWSILVKPGRAVKVKVKEELVPAVVENYTSYQSYPLTVCVFLMLINNYMCYGSANSKLGTNLTCKLTVSQGLPPSYQFPPGRQLQSHHMPSCSLQDRNPHPYNKLILNSLSWFVMIML